MIDIDKFEVLKSEYDESTKKFDLEIKFPEGAYLQGEVHSNSSSNFTYLGLHFHGNSSFKLRLFPSILKMGWTFHIIEEKVQFGMENFYATLEPIDGGRKKITILEDFFKGAPKEVHELRDATLDLFNEIRETIKKIAIEATQDSVKHEFRGFSSVEELADLISKDVSKDSHISEIFECLKKDA